MVSSANSLLNDLDALNEDTTSACVEVEYCIQNLNLISTKQFMEKRVYDEEVTEKKEESITQIQPVITSIDFVPKIKEAIREGLPAVKSQIANFEERINGNSSQSLNTNPNSHYSRSLPYLLGTEEFIDSPTAGVAEGHKFKSGSASNLQLPIQTSNSTLSSVQSSPSLKSNLQVPVPVENRVHSDSDVSSMSEAGGGICNENKEIDETVKNPTLSNLREELSARLKNAGDSKLKTTSEAYVTPNAKVPVKSESQRQELENSIPSPIVAAAQPKTENVSSREIIKPPKKRNLFDDSSSESEGELFKTNLPKVPTVPPNLLSQPESKLPPTTPQLIVAKSNNTPTFSKTKSSTLFGSSDSEDDLFSGAITSNEKSSIPVAKSIGKIAANFSDDEDNIISSQIAKPKTSKLSPTIKVAVPPSKSGSLFDDEDVPDFVAKKSILPVKVAAPVAKPQDQQPVLQTKQPRSELPQQRNLFADSEDSDDDLFRNIVVTKNKAPPLVVSPKTLSSSPLPDKLVTQSSRHQSTPIQNGERKEEQQRPTSAKDNDNKPIHIEQHPKLKAKPSLLFDDDSDDEDLFGGVSVSTKYPPLATKVPALQDFQKDSKGKDLFADVPRISKVPADVAEAIVCSSDDLLSGVLSTKQTSLSGTPFIARKPESSADGSAFGGVTQVTENPTLPIKVAADPTTIKMPSDKHVSSSTSLHTSSKTPTFLPVNIPDNLIGSQPPTLQPSILQRIPVLKAFEESDDEDLFGIKAEKRPSQPVPVKISAKKEEIQHTIKDEDLFVGIMEQKQSLPHPPVIPHPPSQKAPEKTETPSNERDSRQSPETEVKPQAPVESIDKIAGRIASLKLSLAKQPNSLPFSTAGSTASTPNDEEGTPISNSAVRKPFGGVQLFGPRIPSHVKSNPPSPTKAEEKIMPGDSQNKYNEEVGQNSDLLDCVSKQRPKAPGRRLPTRNFRRSQIQDDDDDSMVAKVTLTPLL